MALIFRAPGATKPALEYSARLCLNPTMRAWVVVGLVGALAPLGAASERFSSGASRVSVIELFTSEGCSSCPPADRWLGSLRDKPGLWTEFVPIEFHVSYWDSLGWKDRLSTREFTAREYAYASAWGSSNVYTPCFVRNGEEWKPEWGTPGGAAARTGQLSVEIADDGVCRAEFMPGPAARAAPDGFELHVAVLGGGISSRVTAGENKGETLGHEFVVLGLANRAFPRDSGNAAVRTEVALPQPIAAPAARRAIAVWVTRRGELAPVQATGGWLP
jgi:hypothetical protein